MDRRSTSWMIILLLLLGAGALFKLGMHTFTDSEQRPALSKDVLLSYRLAWEKLSTRLKDAPVEPFQAIFSMATRRKPWDIRPFVCSWHRFASGAHLYIFVDGDQVSAFDTFYSESVCTSPRLHFLPSYWPLPLRSLHNQSVIVHEFHIEAVKRYYNYFELLDQLGTESVSDVLLADSRDTLFQCDPFKATKRMYGKGSMASMENTKVGWETSNNLWVLGLFGQATLERYVKKNAVVSCSGLYIGASQDVLSYLLEMVSRFKPEHAFIPGAHGFDQGIHNYIILEGVVKPVKPPCETTHMFTAGFFETGNNPGIAKAGKINWKGGKLYRTWSGHTDLPCTVHQYDRYTTLLKTVERYYKKYHAGEGHVSGDLDLD